MMFDSYRHNVHTKFHENVLLALQTNKCWYLKHQFPLNVRKVS